MEIFCWIHSGVGMRSTISRFSGTPVVRNTDVDAFFDLVAPTTGRVLDLRLAVKHYLDAVV